MDRLSEGFTNLSPARWSGGNSPSPRRTSGHSVERGYPNDSGSPYGEAMSQNPYLDPMGAIGLGGASASPNGGYLSVNAADHDGPLLFFDNQLNGGSGDGSPHRSKSQYTPTHPSRLGRYVQNADYPGGPPPFHLSDPSPYMDNGEKKTLAQEIHAEGQDVDQISPAAYAARMSGAVSPYDRTRGVMSPDSLDE